MVKSNFHTHSTWCDGRDSPRRMVEAAVKCGFTALGFSGHSYMECEPGYCMSDPDGYKAQIRELDAEYRGIINIYCGVAQDMYCVHPPVGYDYVIGSLHYVCKDNRLYSVDCDRDEVCRTVREEFGSDWLSFCEAYYEGLKHVVQRTGADIIGHFDLVTKYNEGGRLFDEHDPRYVAAWRSAADALLKAGVPFEINTGAISRGYRTSPYPSEDILRYLAAHGAKAVLSSDSHDSSSLDTGFGEAEDLALRAGIPLVDFEQTILGRTDKRINRV